MKKPNNAADEYNEYIDVCDEVKSIFNVHEIPVPVDTGNHCIMYCDNDVIVHVLTRSYITDELDDIDKSSDTVFKAVNDFMNNNYSYVTVVIERHESMLSIMSNEYPVALYRMLKSLLVFFNCDCVD